MEAEKLSKQFEARLKRSGVVADSVNVAAEAVEKGKRELANLTVVELKEIARDMEIAGYSALAKCELVKLIHAKTFYGI